MRAVGLIALLTLAACASGPRGFDDDFAGVKARPSPVALGCQAEPRLVYRALTWPAPADLPPPPVTITVPAEALGANGFIKGRVVDKSTGHGVGDVTVVATSPSLKGSASELTTPDGAYVLENLPPGNYDVTFYFGQTKVRQPGVKVRAGRMTPVVIKVDLYGLPGEIIDIKLKAPTITIGGDYGSPRQPSWVRGVMPDFPSVVGYTKDIPLTYGEYYRVYAVPRDPRADRLCNP